MPCVLEEEAGEEVRQRPAFDKVFWLKLTVSAGLFSGFLLSRKLWLSLRFYPLTPVWPFLTFIVFPFGYVIFGALLALLALIAILPRPRKLILGFICLALAYALFDQSRWQPWFYQYLFMLAALRLSFIGSAECEQRKAALATCRLIVVSIYFWSAVQKLNAGFVHGTFAWMINPLSTLLPATITMRLDLLGFVAPLFELAVGIGLLTRKFRTPAVLGAWFMHLTILASIGPWGHDHNNVVWPWNLAMAAFVFLLFWQEREAGPATVIWGDRSLFHSAALLLFAILPALSLFNDWDSYLSFELYSGNYNTAVIYMTHGISQALPAGVRKYLEPDQRELFIADWSWRELNVPPYPEIRIFKSIGQSICRETGNSPYVLLLVQEKQTVFRPGEAHLYGCAGLSK